jgi:5-methylcytosine-specific restriction endonuclease McrA
LADGGGAFDPSITRRGVLDRDNWACQLCGGPIPDVRWNTGVNPVYGTVDHVVPVSEGGDHTWDNVQAAHFRCNSDKWYGARRSA